MRYRFGDCVLDPGSRGLTRGAKAVALAPQVFDLLEYLLRNRDRLIGKDELIRTIWHGRVVSDAALTTRIYVARCAIGDNGKTQGLIRTFARRGVKFVGHVEEVDERQAGDAPETDIRRTALPPTRVRSPSIAVLAFRNTDGSDHADDVARTVSRELRIELTRLRWLAVTAAYDDRMSCRLDEPDAVAHRMLDAQYVLHGSVKRIGGQYRITAEVVDTVSHVNVWAGRYDTDWTGNPATHPPVAETLAHAASMAIAAAERSLVLAKRPDNLDAWGAYQLGLWHMSRFNFESVETASVCFRHAIDLDPGFAAGHTALAWVHLMAASIYSKASIAEACQLAMPLVLHALALDGADPEARARLALTEFLDGDVQTAIEEAETALSLHASCASAFGVKGAALIATGRHREGRAAMDRFLQQSPNDPVRPVRLTQVAVSYYLDGDYARSARIARQVTRRFPQHPFAYRWLAASLGQLNQREEAAATLDTLRRIWPSSFEMYVAKPPPAYCSAEYKPLLSGLRKAGWRD